MTAGEEKGLKLARIYAFFNIFMMISSIAAFCM
jgi:hypothetical protein